MFLLTPEMPLWVYNYLFLRIIKNTTYDDGCYLFCLFALEVIRSVPSDFGLPNRGVWVTGFLADQWLFGTLTHTLRNFRAAGHIHKSV